MHRPVLSDKVALLQLGEDFGKTTAIGQSTVLGNACPIQPFVFFGNGLNYSNIRTVVFEKDLNNKSYSSAKVLFYQKKGIDVLYRRQSLFETVLSKRNATHRHVGLYALHRTIV
ncbi:MAG: hypothetical protein IPO65_10170 [Saprospiraceae bacterium]|nr:hypothetical protein [Saprospiraceae bacterium]